MNDWLDPERVNKETGERETLIKKIGVVDGMIKEVWLTPTESAKQATSGTQMLVGEDRI